MRRVGQEKHRTLTGQAFQRLLNWLDRGTDSQGHSYLEMRRRLVNYFDRKNIQNPDDMAEETLNRVAMRLEEEGITESEAPARYCYIVARFVLMEQLRSNRRTEALLAEMKYKTEVNALHVFVETENDQNEAILNCLERCINKLEPISREIIIRYYGGKEREKIENRRGLAEGLGLTQNALSIRAFRIRQKLEECVKQCIAKT
jgi:DNA-directed RNA polymerase specialized sigma24 family protein